MLSFFFFPSSVSNNSPLAQLAGEQIVALGPLVIIILNFFFSFNNFVTNLNNLLLFSSMLGICLVNAFFTRLIILMLSLNLNFISSGLMFIILTSPSYLFFYFIKPHVYNYICYHFFKCLLEKKFPFDF